MGGLKTEIFEKGFPMKINISFHKLIQQYRDRLEDPNELVRTRAQQIVAYAEAHPKLETGLTNDDEIEEYQDHISYILEDLFASVLQLNEIKIATIPFQQHIFKSTERYKNIIKVPNEGFELELSDFNDDQLYIMGCSIILNAYYGKPIDFKRPFFYEIPDKNGIVRHYRLVYNGDFIDIAKGPDAHDITDEDIAELLDNFDNIDLWKEKFPPGSWEFKGFVIANMYDATTDVSLSNFKTSLLQTDTKDSDFAEGFERVLRAIFNLPNIKVGYSIFNPDDQTFERPPALVKVNSYLLNGEESESCHTALCGHSFNEILKEHKSYSISDVSRYYKLYPDNALYRKLHAQGVGSAIITPLVHEGALYGVMELVSDTPRELNSINANKLIDILPFLVDSVTRSNEKTENELELMIQSECTSIHPSVHWKFKEEAKRVYKAELDGLDAAFQEIVFDNVFHLYGQIDIKGSSAARNEAVHADLGLQLGAVKKIMEEMYKREPLTIYEQLLFRIDNYLEGMDEHMQVDSEWQVLNFLRQEIIPLFDFAREKDPSLDSLIDKYFDKLDQDKGFMYRHRKDYDQSVMQINKTMASLLDHKQEEAQAMYPHYYERFKTDGVEHNLYIGEDITKQDSFNMIYLYNLRLWQLQAMWEMENKYYQLKEQLPLPLDVTSLVLVFNSSLALRFRMDEKRFDVDGTYNARYEVVKKRVDKAKIKGTDERITQPGKMTIVYSQRVDELEYLKYVKFLQAKHMLGDQVEIITLEDLQGVTGLKAIRVNILYQKEDQAKTYYTYEDLMDEIHN